MRNKYPGACYYCSGMVNAGAGHFERHFGQWRVIHSECVLKQRKEKQAAKPLGHRKPQRSDTFPFNFIN